MKFLFTIFLFISTSLSYSQTIVNLILVGENGVTEDITKATNFIVIKKYPTNFERLDYKLHGPLIKSKTYSDSTLTVLQGRYYEYDESGRISKSGHYLNNQKDKDWWYYNDTAKVILKEKYKNGILINTVNPDTVKEERPKQSTLDKDEREATFKSGDREWIRYLTKNVNADVINQSVNGGIVKVGFMVDVNGKITDAYLRKSVEFVLDEELIRVIESAPLWTPALQHGKKVNAYRVQPLTFPAP